MITGIPSLNAAFLVLCLKTCIPAYAPKLPPSKEIPKSTDSGILHILCFARLLSRPNRRKETILIIRNPIPASAFVIIKVSTPFSIAFRRRAQLPFFYKSTHSRDYIVPKEVIRYCSSSSHLHIVEIT